MILTPKGKIEKLERVLNAWETIAPDGQYGGMTKEQFAAFVNTSKNARATIATLENQINDATILRNSSDEMALAKVKLVKNGVLADPNQGENSSLYESMGYIRQEDKKSGLTRKKNLIKKEG